MGREGRLRVGPWPKVHYIPPPQAGTLHFVSLQNADPKFIGPASGLRSGGGVSYSSRPR
jgi:hypothetical protein